jgi:hypothetical protein
MLLLEASILIWRTNNLPASQCEQHERKKLATIAFMYGKSFEHRFERI